MRTEMPSSRRLPYNHPSVEGITLWGYVVGSTWVNGSGLIQSNGTPRPAMTWLMNWIFQTALILKLKEAKRMCRLPGWNQLQKFLK